LFIKYNKTNLGFSLMITLIVVIGAFSVYMVKSISAETERLYNHPFTVSNAAREIKINMISMHRSMKDVALAQNEMQLDTASAQVEAHEKKVFDSFVIIFDRFLGEKAKIHRVYQSFIAWREIRNEVIALKRAGKPDEAAQITKGKGAAHVQRLTDETQELVDFAAAKAAEFRQNSQENAQQSVIVMSVLAVLAFMLSVLISVYILRKQKQSAEEIKKRAHLIDQNIMIAQLNLDGDVVEISNALCRYLGVLRQNITGTPSHLFITGDDADTLQETIWHYLKTGTQWIGELKRVSGDGTVKWAKMTILPTLNADYAIAGYTCIVQDMTSKKLSLTDNLTTLGNRRQYEETLEREVSLAKRNDSYLTLAILDIDFFKNYNDRYGHPQGDTALSRVGKAIISCMRRPNDYTFRIGGEEFAVLFSAVDRDESRRFLDTIRQAVEDMNIPHEASKVSDHLTISIGGATLSGAALIDAEHLYIDADKALYMAKEGRNQTIMA